ncbi:radical SAM/SPASM domain-containing protein [Halobacteriovorax marinus]|uniref:radical SAM protein n=1 Tax=Halobacteriovorax marinus TaxID=97084 RepID=UPI003A8CD949
MNNLYCQIAGFLAPLINLSPLVLRIRITTKCNLSCSFCYLKSGLNREEEGNLDIEEWKKVFSNLPRRTIVDLTGAEPLMYKDIREFIKILCEKKIKYSMTTNGTVYNGLTAREIVENRLYVLMVSLDGLEGVHDKLRGRSGAFERTVRFIREIEQEKIRQNTKYPFINIKTTVLDENVHELEGLLNELGKSIPCNTLTLSLLFQNRARGGMELFEDYGVDELRKGNTAQYTKKAEVKKFFSSLNYSEHVNGYSVSIRPRMNKKDIFHYIDSPPSMEVESCPLYKNTLTLYFDGKISPCDISLNLGNIRDHGYNMKNTFNGIRYKNFISLFKSGDRACEGCCSGQHTLKRS